MQIGALFPEHQQRKEGCGDIWEQYGIQRTEIALKTIRDLNDILPFKIGITIRDSCWAERVAMEQAIAFLRGGVSHHRPCCTTTGCDEETNAIVAVVGPAKSSTTIAVQNLLQVFRIPQIGYGSTTPDLSDKEQYSYFMRVVPSDAWQSRAIIAILEKYKWRYVAVIYSAGKN
ncbi:unnamed protein product [Enterobius vermicularis]|uniref:ANF_receptor domain-containing protein n=1 Tax=Enterobius vermicularis TaxID=51028 RepID=A0A0N4VMS6_ENTVE|nr:unnamed protein product [Enterobius vermicularis]